MGDLSGIQPVGAQVQPPQSGFSTLDSILGIQQKRQALQAQALEIQQRQQNLQTGLSTQQSAQAGAQVDQQKASELQAVGNLVKGADKYKTPDGGFDSQRFSDDVAKVAPVNGGAIRTQALSAAGESIKNKQAAMNLTGDQNKVIGSALGALASKADLSQTDIINTFDRIADQYQDTPGMRRLLMSNLAHMPQSADPKQLQQMVSQMAGQLQQVSPIVGGTNAASQNINRNQFTGTQQLSGQTPGAPAGENSNPSAPSVAAAGARGTGHASADLDASNNVVNAQRDAKTNIDLTKRIDQLAEVVRPGAAAAEVSKGLQMLGMNDAAEARSELEKDLGRLQTNLSGRAGSDERAKTALTSLPTATKPTDVIHSGMDWVRGTARQDLALGSLREKNAGRTKGNMDNFQGEYAHATAAASPLMHEYLSLSPKEQVGFFKRNFTTKEQAKSFRAQAESVKRMSPDVIGQ